MMINKIKKYAAVGSAAYIAKALKKMRGKNMLSFQFESFSNRLVIKYFAGDFAVDFKLVQAVCKEVLYSRNPIFEFVDPDNEKSDSIRADINLAGKDYIAIHLYKLDTDYLNISNLTFKNIQEWADDIKKYIEGEVRKYDVFIAYLKVHEQITKG